MSERMGIGEFARRVGLAVSAVRFYGDRGLLPPAAVDPVTGYRSYRADQVRTGALIRDLRRLDLPLADVAAYLDAGTDDRRALLTAHLDRLGRRLAAAHRLAHDLDHGLQATTGSEPPMTTTLTVPARDLGAALDQVLPAAGRDPECPVLTCVLVEGRDGSLRLAATDRYRLAVRDVVPIGGGDRGGAAFRGLVPAATLRRWRRELPASDDVSVGVRDDHVVVRAEPHGVDLRAPAVPAAFPDYERVMAQEREACAVVIGREALLGALARFTGDDEVTGDGKPGDDVTPDGEGEVAVAGVGDRPGKVTGGAEEAGEAAGEGGADGDRRGGAVLFQAGRGRLTLVRRDEEVTLEVDHDGPELHVVLDPGFATQAVTAAVGPEVVVEIADALRPVVFRSADDGTFTTMLMPVRLA